MTGKHPISALEDHIGYWLRFVSNHVSQSFARKLDDQGVTVSEWVALRCLYDLEESSQNNLAQAMGMTKAPVSRIVDRLVAKKLARRAAHAHDARTWLVRLTIEGRTLVPKLAALADTNDRAFFDCLSEKEQAALTSTMRKLVAHHELSHLPTE